jgi:quinolinate synthase
MLSQKAAESDAKYIVFCGVHFMAESADILTSDEQVVVLPNMRAGCSMADMATLSEVESAWTTLLEEAGLDDPIDRDDPTAVAGSGEKFLVPVTYMNSSADLKDFVGRHGGIVCTSSNAQGVLNWAFERAGKDGAVLFFPDQHLGRNTGNAMGISLDLMPTWTPGIGAMGELNVQLKPWKPAMPTARRNTFETSSDNKLLAQALRLGRKSTWWRDWPMNTPTNTSNASMRKSVHAQQCT